MEIFLNLWKDEVMKSKKYKKINTKSNKEEFHKCLSKLIPRQKELFMNYILDCYFGYNTSQKILILNVTFEPIVFDYLDLILSKVDILYQDRIVGYGFTSPIVHISNTNNIGELLLRNIGFIIVFNTKINIESPTLLSFKYFSNGKDKIE